MKVHYEGDTIQSTKITSSTAGGAGGWRKVRHYNFFITVDV